MSSTAPAFENKATCTKCNTTFNLFTRKHHCRQCGRTYCDRCSSWNIPLPHYGFNEPVRVDEKCYQAIQQKQAQGKSPASSGAVATASPAASGASTSTATSTPTSSSDSASTSTSTPAPAPAAPVRTRPCTCNMPLCICPPDEPETKTDNSTTPNKQAQKPVPRIAASKTPASSSSSSSSSFSGFGSFPSARSSASAAVYDLQGDLNEQCRDAIKSGDHKGVITLITAGANPNYVDRTGNTLLHLACMFDRWETVQLLLSRGGNITIRNPAGETPVDLAPPSLAHKIKQYGAPSQ